MVSRRSARRCSRVDQRPAAREPDRGLRGGVAASDHPDPGTGAQQRLGRPGAVEDGDPLVLVEPLHREPAVLGPGRDHDHARGYLVTALEADAIAAVGRTERSAR